MTASETDDGAHGPIDYLLLQFPSDADTTAAGAALLGLVDSGAIAIYDLLVVRKDTDGSAAAVDSGDLSAHGLGGFAPFAGARSGLLGSDDVAEAGGVMDPGTVAALFVYENTWAIPFVRAALGANAEVLAGNRIPATDVSAALDALDAADAAN